jgi:hypothetical protein
MSTLVQFPFQELPMHLNDSIVVKDTGSSKYLKNFNYLQNLVVCSLDIHLFVSLFLRSISIIDPT